METMRTRSIQAAILVGLGWISAASAALPLHGGPGMSPDDPNAYTDPRMDTSRMVTNNGRALAMVTGTERSYPIRWGVGMTESVLMGPSSVPATVDVNGFAINSTGTVAGATITLEPPYTSYALRWGATTTTPTVLHALNAPFTSPFPRIARDMNEAGVAVGASVPLGTELKLSPVKWNAGTQTATGLATLSGDANSAALVISDSGWIGGVTSNATLDIQFADARPVRWNPSGQISELGSLSFDPDGNSQAFINQMNNSGVSVGMAALYANDGTALGSRAVRWGSSSTAISQLQAYNVTGDSDLWQSEALSVNDAGVSIGNAFFTGDVFDQRAMRWQSNSTNFELLNDPNNEDPEQSGANQINNLGTIAGYTFANNTSDPLAVIWPKGSNIAVDLNTRISNDAWGLEYATHVSDTGFVAGRGFFDPDAGGPIDSYTKLFVMLVPEAGTYGMGDANFDTNINFDDLLIVAQNYDQANPDQSYNVGDFNLDGETDFNDLLLIAQNYGFELTALQSSQLTSGFLSDWSAARASIPEPGILVFAPLALLATIRRR